MAVFRPFKAIRPLPEYADKVAALPYDVMSSKEAAVMVAGNKYSFLHIDKAEIDLPEGTDLYSEKVYLKARSNLDSLVADEICRQDEHAHFYIYRQIMNGRAQTGIVGCVSIDDYINNVIKKHELTRADKEQDRINHVDYCNANTGPIFLTYRPDKNIKTIIESCCKDKPVCNFITEDGITNTVWVINDDKIIKNISDLFAETESLYIADGHHRAASAVKVGLKRREEKPAYDGNEEFNFFLAVLFDCDELEIMDYNRLIKDLNGYSVSEFIDKVSEKFIVEKTDSSACYKPESRHTFGMLLDGKWYKLTAKEGTFDESDPVSSLDVSILQSNLISPILGIDDPRTDKRIDFVGGIRGLGELEKRVKDDMRIAFSMYPTSIEELIDIADAGKIMPPKSTWFEPKLLSGLFIHSLE